MQSCYTVCAGGGGGGSGVTETAAHFCVTLSNTKQEVGAVCVCVDETRANKPHGCRKVVR